MWHTYSNNFSQIFIFEFKWFLWGYSLVFSPSDSHFIGNLDKIVLRNVGSTPIDLAPTIPENCFMIYQW